MLYGHSKSTCRNLFIPPVPSQATLSAAAVAIDSESNSKLLRSARPDQVTEPGPHGPGPARLLPASVSGGRARLAHTALWRRGRDYYWAACACVPVSRSQAAPTPERACTGPMTESVRECARALQVFRACGRGAGPGLPAPVGPGQSPRAAGRQARRRNRECAAAPRRPPSGAGLFGAPAAAPGRRGHGALRARAQAQPAGAEAVR